MTDTHTPAHAHPRHADIQAPTEQTTGPGSPFEVVTEQVLGEPMGVFKNRPGSLREVFAGSAVHGDRDCMIFSDDRHVTYADLQRQVASTAAWLRHVHGA